ncbi:MAG: hypothetical protein WAV90_25100 [Gordonia amarae]
MDVGDIFYELPADELVEGLSTDDGCDIVSVATSSGGMILASVYQPGSIASGQGETRAYVPGQLVRLGVFDGTEVDRSRHRAAKNRRAAS